MTPMLRPLLKKSFHPVSVVLWGCLVFVGCSGCGQKTAPQTPTPETLPTATPPPETPATLTPRKHRTPLPEATPPQATDQNAVVFQVDKYDDLIPWAPSVNPPDVQKRVDAIIKNFRAEKPLGKITEEVRRAVVAEVGAVAWARRHIGHPATRGIIDQARAENPNDFDTLITWAHIHGAGLWNIDPERNVEHIAVLRQLYQMRPNHPYVLYRLAAALYPTLPEEALGYALRAEVLEPRYIALGIPGLCYVQMGEYKNAIAVYERARTRGSEKQRSITKDNLERLRSWIIQEPDAVKRRREKQQPVLFH